MSTQKENIIRILGVTPEEADKILAYDKQVDRAKASDRLEYDIDKEKEKIGKKFANSTTRERKQPTIYKFENKTRKANPTKAGIIAEIAQFLTEKGYEKVEIIKKEREIAFNCEDNNFSLTLVQHRKKKGEG